MAVWQKGSKESLLAADESCDSLRVNSIRPNYCGRDPSPQYSLLRTVMSVLWRCSCEIDRIDTVLGANREVINRSNLKSNCEGAPRSWGPTDLLTEKNKTYHKNRRVACHRSTESSVSSIMGPHFGHPHISGPGDTARAHHFSSSSWQGAGSKAYALLSLAGAYHLYPAPAS